MLASVASEPMASALAREASTESDEPETKVRIVVLGPTSEPGYTSCDDCIPYMRSGVKIVRIDPD